MFMFLVLLSSLFVADSPDGGIAVRAFGFFQDEIRSPQTVGRRMVSDLRCGRLLEMPGPFRETATVMDRGCLAESGFSGGVRGP
jgi:hypothetical protein